MGDLHVPWGVFRELQWFPRGLLHRWKHPPHCASPEDGFRWETSENTPLLCWCKQMRWWQPCYPTDTMPVYHTHSSTSRQNHQVTIYSWVNSGSREARQDICPISHRTNRPTSMPQTSPTHRYYPWLLAVSNATDLTVSCAAVHLLDQRIGNIWPPTFGSKCLVMTFANHSRPLGSLWPLSSTGCTSSFPLCLLAIPFWKPFATIRLRNSLVNCTLA